MNLKELLHKIMVDKPETRNSRALLKWEVLKEKGFTRKSTYDGEEYIEMSKEDFIKWETDTVRRCSQQLQREDLLLGKNLIQPTKSVKEKRVKLSKEKGFSYIQGKEPVFNPKTQCYEIT